jgi:hypothetical protein
MKVKIDGIMDVAVFKKSMQLDAASSPIRPGSGCGAKSTAKPWSFSWTIPCNGRRTEFSI